MKRLAIVILLAILGLTIGLPSIVAASPGNLVNSGFETGDLTGWTKGTVVDFADVVTADSYASPYQGNYMVRLGTPCYTGQPIGPNEIYQVFTAVDSTLTFNYNIFTYDYAGWDRFGYELRAMDTGEVIAFHSQTAWGQGTALKSTGWQEVNLDVSNYIGRPLRLLIICGGTGDHLFTTWAYIDGLPYIEVEIDIKPGSDPNSINPDSRGVIPVAILTTSTAVGEPVTFDATTVDPATVGFGPAKVGAVHFALEDVDGDGDIDVILHFKAQETGIQAGDTEVTLTGTTDDGIPIQGTDTVNTVPKGKGK